MTNKDIASMKNDKRADDAKPAKRILLANDERKRVSERVKETSGYSKNIASYIDTTMKQE